VSERLTILVIVGTRTDAHSLRSQVGMGSESDCLLGQCDRTLSISKGWPIVNYREYRPCVVAMRPFVKLL